MLRKGPLPLALPSAPAAHDQAVGALVLLARAVTERRHAPRGNWVAAGGGRALAAAVRVVDGVHRGPAGLRAHAHVALAAGLADLDVLVVGVADRAHGRPAVRADHAHLARRQAQRRHVAVLGHELDRRAGGAAELASAAGLQLHVVDDRADGHVAQRERVADRDLRARARLHRGPDPEAVRGEDVALLAVGVVQQRDVCRAVRVVLDRRDLRGHPVLAALEVDPAVQTLGATAAVARRLAPAAVAPARLREALGERLLGLRAGDVGEVGIRREAPAGARGLGLADRHRQLALQPLKALEDRDRVARAHLHERERPAVSPRRFGLDFTEAVRTSTTLTSSKSASTAWRIWVLCASGWTRNVYLSLAAST